MELQYILFFYIGLYTCEWLLFHMSVANCYHFSFILQASKKKVYMLYDLEPDRSVTGGAWYCDQDFEAEFVDVLNQQCYRYLQQKLEATKDCKGGPIAAQNSSYASSKDVWKYISELGISKVITYVLAHGFISTGFVISR
jgi:DNA-directed RNA polymerase III, subunit C34